MIAVFFVSDNNIHVVLLFHVQEIESKNAKIDNLSDENCKLVGHQNHKQKIHYTVTLKDENTTLREVSVGKVMCIY